MPSAKWHFMAGNGLPKAFLLLDFPRTGRSFDATSQLMGTLCGKTCKTNRKQGHGTAMFCGTSTSFCDLQSPCCKDLVQFCVERFTIEYETPANLQDSSAVKYQ